MRESALIFVLSLVLVFNHVHTYKILGVFPLAVRSHYILENALMKGLAEAGHNVTMLSVFEDKNPPKNGNYKEIVLKEVFEEQTVFLNTFRSKSTGKKTENIFNKYLELMITLNTLGYKVSDTFLSHPETQKLIASKKKFDIVIVPQVYIEALKALAPHFGSHLVVFNTVSTSSWINNFVGNSILPSLYPEMVLGFSSTMNLMERLINTICRLVSYFNQHFFHYPSQVELVHKYISKDIDLYQTQYNVSLVLSNGHTSLNYVGSSVPCMIDIAGFHVQPPKKLPQHLQNYLDNAKEGVIYFSMGSSFNSILLPPKTRNILMNVFSRRKERILWKFEDDNLPGKPENVKIEKWLPQSDLLAHPNIKLFITHGGLLSTIETVYHGVPTVALPIAGDQEQNARVAENIGFAKMLNFAKLTEETLYNTIEEVITNKKYRESAKERSKIFHDRPLKPLDEAIYWLEYIVRHNGANHLRVGYLDLVWYQYYMIDVFAIIFGVIFVIYFSVSRTLRLIFSRLFSDDKKNNKIKKQ